MSKEKKLTKEEKALLQSFLASLSDEELSLLLSNYYPTTAREMLADLPKYLRA